MLGFATNWKTFADVKKENLGQDKPDYFTTKATIVFLKKENCMYMVSMSMTFICFFLWNGHFLLVCFYLGAS